MKKIIIYILILFFILSGNIFAEKCSDDLILNQNLKAPENGQRNIKNGQYNYYTKGKVREAHILQKHLNRLGFNVGLEDGIIGPKTKKSILEMQKFLGTIADGFIGPKTRKFLNNSCDKNEKLKSNTVIFENDNVKNDNIDSEEYEEINFILEKGLNDKNTNLDVSRLQKILKKDYFEMVVDGDFGKNTEIFLKKFTKNKLGFEMDYFDPRLFREEKEVTEKNYNPKKISEILGYGKFDFFYVNFPFDKSKINSVYCGKAKKDFIFKNEKIIFPISKDGGGKFSCYINVRLDGKNKKFEVVDVYFKNIKRPTTKVNLTKKYSSGPTTKTQKRINEERKMLKNIYAQADKKIKFESFFENPLDTEKLSPFGKVRIFNDGRRSVHSGTDFKAQSPVEVKVVNDGEVILSNIDLYYCGKGVIINHGLNIFSTYCHLSENKVKIGDKVKKGQVVGLTGSTGRVSGPHLHLSVKYNGGFIDFEDLEKKSKISFK